MIGTPIATDYDCATPGMAPRAGMSPKTPLSALRSPLANLSNAVTPGATPGGRKATANLLLSPSSSMMLTKCAPPAGPARRRVPRETRLLIRASGGNSLLRTRVSVLPECGLDGGDPDEGSFTRVLLRFALRAGPRRTTTACAR